MDFDTLHSKHPAYNDRPLPLHILPTARISSGCTRLRNPDRPTRTIAKPPTAETTHRRPRFAPPHLAPPPPDHFSAPNAARQDSDDHRPLPDPHKRLQGHTTAETRTSHGADDPTPAPRLHPSSRRRLPDLGPPPPPPDHPPTEVSRRIPPQDIVRRAIRQPQHDPTPAAAPSRPGHTSQPPPETAARAPRQIKTQKKERIIRSVLCKWYHQESNRGHKDFQSFALPTELWHQPDDNPFRF